MNRLERISAILVKLQSRPLVTAKEIAEQFGVSMRTVYRDIRTLEQSGIPVTGEAGQGYALVDGFKLPPLMFTIEEALSFLMAEKLVSHQTDGDTYGVYRCGMDKIRAVLKTTDKDMLQHFERSIHITKSKNAPLLIPGNILQPLMKSLLRKEQINIKYKAGYNYEVTHRTVEPQGIFFMCGDWYLLAWCKLRNDYRTFHLGRVISVEITEQSFEIIHPPIDKLIKIMYYNCTDINIVLRVHRDAVRDMGKSRYAYGLCEESADGEYYIQRYQTYSLEKFGRWYLMFADKCKIIEPRELKNTVRKLIDSIQL